jgi:hypothetical protein
MNDLLPPQYVNIRSDVIYSLDLPDPLCRTYIRLAGMAWKDKLGKQRELPPLHEDVLCKVLGLKRSSLWGQMQALKKHELIAWTSQNGVFDIHILPKPANRVQNFGLGLNDDVDDDLNQEQDKDSTTSTTRVQNFGLVQEALAFWGIAADTPEAERLAALPTVTPDLIQAWGEHLSAQHAANLVPILLAYQLEHSAQPPKEETRGGNRLKAAEATQPMLNLEAPMELPVSVQGDLAAIGWSGLGDEVLRAWQKDAGRVQSWLDYAIGLPSRQIKTSRAALFRSGIRSNQPPPYRIPRQAQQTDSCLPLESMAEEVSEEPFESPWPEADLKARQAWEWAISQLQLDMPRSAFVNYVQDAVAVAFNEATGLFTIGAPTTLVRDWLDGRLSSTVIRLLSGILKRTVTVQFVCPEKEGVPCGS